MNKKIETSNNQDIFSLSLSNHSDLPLFHKNYYDNHVLMKIAKENSKITSGIVIRKDSYSIDEFTVKEIEDYTIKNLNKLLKINNNQNNDPLLEVNGGSSTIIIKTNSKNIKINLSNILDEEDRKFFNDFYKSVIKLIEEKGTIEKNKQP